MKEIIEFLEKNPGKAEMIIQYKDELIKAIDEFQKRQKVEKLKIIADNLQKEMKKGKWEVQQSNWLGLCYYPNSLNKWNKFHIYLRFSGYGIDGDIGIWNNIGINLNEEEFKRLSSDVTSKLSSFNLGRVENWIDKDSTLWISRYNYLKNTSWDDILTSGNIEIKSNVERIVDLLKDIEL